jgi:hypothetical protein
MSILEAKTIEPATATTVTLGAAGETVAISASQLKTNTIKDAGGNTLLTSNGSGTLSSVNSALGSTMVFISSQTATASSSIEFTSGIDSTYDEYVFYFLNINVSANSDNFVFQVNASGQTGFNETMTTTSFRSYHGEDGSTGVLNYDTSQDQGQGTSYQTLSQSLSNATDVCCAGELHLFAPSSTTYVKHFYSRFNGIHDSNLSMQDFIAGYINTTAAITQISFKPESGTFDGTIYMYGIK